VAEKAEALMYPITSILTLSTVVMLSAHLAAWGQDATESRLQQACLALQRTSQAAADLQTLLDASRNAALSPALRGRAIAAYSLALLEQGNTNAFERALLTLRATYPETVPLIKVSRSDVITTDNGSQQMLKPKAAIRDNFNVIVAGIAALVQENARFAEQFSLAAKETDTDQRIALLKNLLQTFPHRTDLVPAQALLLETVKARAAREALRSEQEARALEERELAELRKLSTAKNINDAIATLNTYLNTHPNVAALLELQILRNELVVKKERNATNRKLLKGVFTLLGVLVFFAVLTRFLFRKRTQRFGPLPGMGKIDKTKFTDPLSLAAQHSRSRAQSKPDPLPDTDE